MSIFKCKMCGGTLEFNPGDTVAVCDSCGTKQTLPKLDDDRRVNLYDRANHFRRNNEYDKAMGIYEQILSEDTTDAEAYWSLVLCRYGIEYVEDPVTHKRMPTVNRAQFTSIFDDDNYKSALQYADFAQREVYESEAKAINEIQKGILAISQKEQPFDVFICYKETGSDGHRTPDSVLANDLYHQLTQEGFKVFFSRITLEDKLGSAYEPYIFAALNSAKVMVVLGTRPEYFNAVWVKNEWSRYLALVKNSSGKKMLIPAYKDMDPYDLPEEFSHLQAQDMSKLGFMQDLIRGIRKILSTNTPKEAVKETVLVSSGSSAGVEPLLKRAFMFLEDGSWQEADAYCEKVLDLDPENARAYLGKLMAELKVRKQERLADCERSFENNRNYQKILRFGGKELQAALSGYVTHINERNETARLTGIYDTAVHMMGSADSEETYQAAAVRFQGICGFRNADNLAQECLAKAEVCRKDKIYHDGCQYLERSTIDDVDAGIRYFKSIPSWKDADEQIKVGQRKLEQIREKENADRLAAEREAEERRIASEKAAKKCKKAITIVTPIVCVCIAFIILLTTVIIPKAKYNKAMDLIDSGDYDSAYALLEELGNSEAIVSSKYDRALALIESGDYELAYDLLEELGNNEAIMSNKYDRAVALIESGDYVSAYMLLKDLDYKDSASKLNSIKPQYQKISLSKAAVGDYVFFGTYEQDNNTSDGEEEIEWIVLAKENSKVLVISKYALDGQQYNSSYKDITWETCSLRTWMNETFLNKVFSADEQAKIATTNVSENKDLMDSTDPGNATMDKVFLLSIAEAKEYFMTAESRKCVPTAYAKAQGVYTGSGYTTVSGEATCWWWLRSPGHDQRSAALGDYDGSVLGYGVSASGGFAAVRPALWISLE